MEKDKLTFIDLFAGCGGLSEGFLQTGKYDALAHVEWELPMVKTLRERLISKWMHSESEAYKRVIHFDIQKSEELINGNWSSSSIEKFGKTNSEEIIQRGLAGLIGNTKLDLIIGGPPCQAYSIAGRAQDKDSMKFDYRNFLFESFVKVVNFFKPSFFLFENVPGLLSAKPGEIPVTERIYEAFKNIGYEIRKPDEIKKSVYNSYDFGVPQKRNRVIIIGVIKSKEISLETLYKSIDDSRNKTSKKNIEDFISHLPPLFPLKKTEKLNGKNISHTLNGEKPVKYHEPRFHNERDVDIFRKWIRESMNSKSSREKILFYNDLMGKSSNHAKYRNLEWDKPSPTIVAHLYKDGLMFIHPDIKQARSITVKEASLLQSFPDDFEFYGSIGDCFKMIGNAVPPLMAENIAKGISTCINRL